MLGERIPHSMARAGASDTLTLRYAAEAYRKAHALDPGYMIGLMQLQLAEAALGDTAAAFRLAREYLARVPDGREADQFRCVLKGASGAGILRSEDLAGLGPVAIGRCLYDLNGLYPYAHEARDTIAAYLDRQSESSEVMQLAGGMMYLVALDRGRPAQAKRYVDAMHQASLVSWADHVSSVIRDALYGGADSTAASTAATEIGARLARSDPGLSESDRIEVLCALGQWHASRSDFADAALEADRLRALSRAEETNTHMRAVHCARLLDAWVAFGTGAPDLDGRVTALNDMLIDGAHDARLLRESAFLLARIHEARGRPALGLEAIDRARFTRPAATYAAAFFRERGRLAAMVGDTAGARDSFRRYLSRRTDPEAHVQAEVDRVREELESLGG
jgi:tetratricopeptide (TPR) repeat protein